MPICSYLVITDEGEARAVSQRLAGVPSCATVAAANRDVVILVTETRSLEEEGELRATVEAMPGIQALLMTFGEIDPNADYADPIALGER